MLIDFQELVQRYNLPVNKVLHVGGNIGEEFEQYEAAGTKEVLWVEPRAEAAAEIAGKKSGRMKSLVACVAAGEQTMQNTLFVASNGQSSSTLEPGEHLAFYPDISFESGEDVKVRPTVDLCDELMGAGWVPDFVNVDTQGTELTVLRGLSGAILSVSAIYLEVNTRPLYKGGHLLTEVAAELMQAGFVQVDTQMTDAGWGDALFVNQRVLDALLKY